MAEPLSENHVRAWQEDVKDNPEAYGPFEVQLFATIDAYKAQAELRGEAGEALAGECCNVDASLVERAEAVRLWDEAIAVTPEEALQRAQEK